MRGRLVRAGLVLGLIIVGMPAYAYAQYTSPSYSVEEIFIGGGSQQEACSGNIYCSNQSAGGSAVGDSESTSFQIQGGSETTEEAVLEVQVTNNAIDFGVLNTSGTAAASFNFNVKTYLSEGYSVKINGDSPTNATGAGTHSLTALNAPSVSQIGVEQFGLNLVANTTPGIGVSPVQVPDNTFAYGAPSVGYGTANHYKYVDGDTIAESAISGGETQFTVSVIANISTTTPGGRYATTLVLQVIPTY